MRKIFSVLTILICFALLFGSMTILGFSLEDTNGYVYDETQRYESSWVGFQQLHKPTSAYTEYYLGTSSSNFDKVFSWTNSSIETSVSDDGELTFLNLTQNTQTKLNSPNSEVVQAKPVLFSLDLFFDGSFSGMKFCYQTTTNLFSILPSGKVLLQNGDQSGYQLQPGWNTIRVYDFPTLSGEKVTAHQNYLYVSPSSEVMETNGVSMLQLQKMVPFNWNTSSASVSFGKCTNLNFIWNTDSVSPVSFSVRNVKVINLNQVNAKSCTIEDKTNTSYSFGIESVNLPDTVGGGSLFTDGNNRMYHGGENLYMNKDYNLSPLKLTQGTMVLASSYSLNLKVKVAGASFNPTQICVSDGENTYLGVYNSTDQAYIFSITNIPASQFGVEKQYTISILFGDKEYNSSASTTYSPYIYAVRMFQKNTTSAELKNLLVNLVQYADAAQGESSTLLQSFCEEVSISKPNCDSIELHVPKTNCEQITDKIQIGAVLSESVSLVITADNCTSITANGKSGTTYLKVNNLGPGNIYKVFSIEVEKDSQIYSGTYSIATYLNAIMSSNGADTSIGHLARATAAYMLAAAAYAE